MKRTLATIGITALMALITASPAAGAPNYRPVGDANGDMVINMGDVTMIEYQLLGMYRVQTYSDANWDGEVDMGDITYIERVILGISPQIHP